MRPYYLFLAGLWVALAVYTGKVIADHGLNLLPVFFGDIAKGGWPGQFNLDFLIMLVLSANWTAWRNRFSGSGILLALLAFVGGAGFLLPYLVYLSIKHGGDTRAILLGANLAEARA